MANYKINSINDFKNEVAKTLLGAIHDEYNWPFGKILQRFSEIKKPQEKKSTISLSELEFEIQTQRIAYAMYLELSNYSQGDKLDFSKEFVNTSAVSHDMGMYKKNFLLEAQYTPEGYIKSIESSMKYLDLLKGLNKKLEKQNLERQNLVDVLSKRVEQLQSL